MLAQRTVTVIPQKLPLLGQRRKNGVLRVAAYCRVSTDQEEQQTSYQGQIEYYTQKIESNAEWKLAQIFADEGITGTSAKKRPDFLRMIEQCKAGKIDLVLTKSISRFSRNTLECLKYIRMLKDLRIPVIFEKENINTMEIASEMMISFLGAFAQAESESISKNVSLGKRYAYKEGKVSFNYKSLLGYRKGADGNPEIDPEEATVIRKIFGMFIDGSSLDTIKANLESQNIKTPMGKDIWSKEVLRSILSNVRYKGDALLQKTYVADCISKKVRKNNGELPQYYVQNSHPAIISPDIFDHVQVEMARRTGKRQISDKTKTHNGKYSSKFALTELLVCGCCGTSYRRVTWARNGSKKIVWRCINRLNHGAKYCKDSPTIEEYRLHSVLNAAVNHIYEHAEHVKYIVKQNVATVLSQDDEIDVITIRKHIDDLNKQMMELVRSNVRERSDMNELEQSCEKISAEISCLQDTLHKKEKDNLQKSASRYRLDEICDILGSQSSGFTEYDDSLVRKILEQVKVIDENTIRVTFKGGFTIEQKILE